MNAVPNEPRHSLLRRTSGLLLPLLSMLAATLQPLHAGTIFYDNFTSSTLNPSWQVLPGNGSYTVGGGVLQYFDDGPVSATTGWYNGALTLALPFSGTNWEFDTKATYSLAWCTSGSYTGPPVPNGSCSAGAQAPEVAVTFDPGVTTSPDGGPDYAGNDYAVFARGTDAYYGSNYLSASYGSVSNTNLLNPADTNINDNIADGTYWLQIVRAGGTLTMNYSYDGTHYMTAFSTLLANPSGTTNELLLGGITYLSAGSFTDYSFVDITSPSAPEPASYVLIACAAITGLLIGVGRRRFAGARR